MTRALCSWSAGRRGQPLATMRGVPLLMLFMASLVACSASAPTLPTGPSAAAPTASATPPAVDPYRGLPNVPRFRVSSSDVVDGKPMPVEQLSDLGGVPGGKDSSPQLTWTGFPAATKSFVVTVFDPDAPTGSGFWHWAVMDIPPSTHSLPSGAGSPDSGLLPRRPSSCRTMPVCGGISAPRLLRAPVCIGTSSPSPRWTSPRRVSTPARRRRFSPPRSLRTPWVAATSSPQHNDDVRRMMREVTTTRG